MLKLIECETQYAVTNASNITKCLIECAIGKSQTLETGLQIESGHNMEYQTESETSRDRTIYIGLYANKNVVFAIITAWRRLTWLE